MIIGCTLPLLLIFIAPLLGLGSGASLFIYMLAMFACHLLMPMKHPGHHRSEEEPPTTKTKQHAYHD